MLLAALARAVSQFPWLNCISLVPFQRRISKYPVVAKIVRDKRFFALGGHVGTLDNYVGVQIDVDWNMTGS